MSYYWDKKLISNTKKQNTVYLFVRLGPVRLREPLHAADGHAHRSHDSLLYLRAHTAKAVAKFQVQSLAPHVVWNLDGFVLEVGVDERLKAVGNGVELGSAENVEWIHACVDDVKWTLC